MTQDWSHIPIHIRCTQRERIDPNYPLDGTKFWKLVEGTSTVHRTNSVYEKIPRVVLEFAYEIREDRLALENLAGICRVPVELISERAHGVIRGEGHGVQREYREMSKLEIARDEWLKENE